MDGALREIWEIGGHEVAIAVDDHNNLPNAITQPLVDILTREFPNQIFDIIDVDDEGQQCKVCRLRNQDRTELPIFQSPAEGVYMASSARNVSFIRDIVYASRNEMDVHAVIDVVTSGTFIIHLQHQDKLLWVAVGGTSKQNLLTSEGARKAVLLEHGVKNVRFVGPFGMHKYDMLISMSQWKEMMRIGFKVAVMVKG